MLRSYVLCGGTNRRMGSDKARLAHPAGGTLLEHARRLAAAAGDYVALLSGERARYPDAKLPELTDLLAGAGPLGGIGAALSDAYPQPALILPVDLPYLGVGEIRALIRRFVESEAPLVIAKAEDGLHPSLGIWRSVDCLEKTERFLRAGKYKLQDLAAELGALPLTLPGAALRNWNRPEDLEP